MSRKMTAGRPKRKWTDEQIKEIEDCALAGCQTRTIATITGIREDALRRNFTALLLKKRAERKRNLRDAQNRLASQGNPAMLIFLGKNYLDQSDKREIGGEIKLTLAVALAELAAKDRESGPGVASA